MESELDVNPVEDMLTNHEARRKEVLAPENRASLIKEGASEDGLRPVERQSNAKHRSKGHGRRTGN